MSLAERLQQWRDQLRAAEHDIFSAASLGELVRDFQHKVNDQLDHDRAFKHKLVAIPVNGVMPGW